MDPKEYTDVQKPRVSPFKFFFHLKNIYVFGCIWVLAAACWSSLAVVKGLSSSSTRALLLCGM